MPVGALDPYDDRNIFARILRGGVPCRKVMEDAFALAFHDINPQALAPFSVRAIRRMARTGISGGRQETGVASAHRRAISAAPEVPPASACARGCRTAPPHLRMGRRVSKPYLSSKSARAPKSTNIPSSPHRSTKSL